MSKKMWMVLIAASLIAAAIPVSNAESGSVSTAGIEPYNGLIGADSPFYCVKLFLQQMDVSLEGNASARLQKHLSLGQERLSEARAVALRDNPGALNAALNEYMSNLAAVNTTLDDEQIDDLTYINASDELQDQEDILANMTNSSDVPPAISDLYNHTLNYTQQIKNGRPFIYCNNTSYFIPPGQMKKIAMGGQSHVPPGLAKKGYVSPEPILVNGTVVWPWDDSYNLYTNSLTNVTGSAGNIAYVSTVKGKHGKGNGNGNGNGKK